MNVKFLAIDLGGTDIKYALMTRDAEIIEKSKVPTPELALGSIEVIIEVLSDIISQYYGQIEGIALSMPGILNSFTGDTESAGLYSHYLSHNNLPRLLQAHFDLPITVENDGKAAALSELWKGGLKDVDNGAVVILGTAVGGGIIIDRKLYRGNTFAAGEMSFMLTNNDDNEFWGGTGGSSYLVRLVSEKLDIPLEELNGYKVFELANDGDAQVLEILKIYTDKLARQLYSMQALLDLDLFAIGGGISRQPILHEYLQQSINEYCDAHPFLEFMPRVPVPKITTCKFFNDSNLIGALYHHLTLTGQID